LIAPLALVRRDRRGDAALARRAVRSALPSCRCSSCEGCPSPSLCSPLASVKACLALHHAQAGLVAEVVHVFGGDSPWDGFSSRRGIGGNADCPFPIADLRSYPRGTGFGFLKSAMGNRKLRNRTQAVGATPLLVGFGAGGVGRGERLGRSRVVGAGKRAPGCCGGGWSPFFA